MNKTLLLVAVIACALASTAIAATLPSYYPAEGFQRTGIVDAVYADEGRIVIGDISYSQNRPSCIPCPLTAIRSAAFARGHAWRSN
jgi:opacity protein-like surface antigen